MGKLSTTVNFPVTSVKSWIVDLSSFRNFQIRTTASQSMVCVQNRDTHPYPASFTQAAFRAPSSQQRHSIVAKTSGRRSGQASCTVLACSKHRVSVSCYLCSLTKESSGVLPSAVTEMSKWQSEKIWPAARTLPAVFNFSFLGIEAGRMGKNVIWQVTSSLL